jgi:hypothetical protein
METTGLREVPTVDAGEELVAGERVEAVFDAAPELGGLDGDGGGQRESGGP